MRLESFSHIAFESFLALELAKYLIPCWHSLLFEVSWGRIWSTTLRPIIGRNNIFDL